MSGFGVFVQAQLKNPLQLAMEGAVVLGGTWLSENVIVYYWPSVIPGGGLVRITAVVMASLLLLEFAKGNGVVKSA